MTRSLQRQIVAELGVHPSIDPAVEIDRRVQFLVDYLLATGSGGYVLGISGGQDSTLAGRLTQLAVERVRAGSERGTGAATADGANTDEAATAEAQRDVIFVAVRLPYGVQADEPDAAAALEFIRPDRSMRVDIKPAADAACADTARSIAVAAVATRSGARGDHAGYDELRAGTHAPPLRDFVRGNVKARQRMVVQYAIAGQLGMLVVGTDHAAEAVTGFYTKFGDGAADLTPLAGLTKRQGATLLAHLGADKRLYRKVPTADLEDERPGLSDEDALGVSYAAIDDYLEGKPVAGLDAGRIEHLYRTSRHKRALPPGPADTWWR